MKNALYSPKFVPQCPRSNFDLIGRGQWVNNDGASYEILLATVLLSKILAAVY